MRPRASASLVSRALALALVAPLVVACSSERPPADPAAGRTFVFEVPAPVASASYERFVALGDWGTGQRGQRTVARAMEEWSAANPIDFVLTLGDNFYPRGVDSVDDDQWEDAFEEMYDAPSVQVPWYVTLGNHDHLGAPDAQVRYGQEHPRWVMPSRNHDFVRTLADGTTLHVVVLDTTPIHDGDAASTERQLAWARGRLAASTARWKLVAGHHPLHTNSGRGDDDAMIDAVEPLLKAHQVDLYLCGHDHVLELLVRDGVHHLVSGAGAGVEKANRVEWVDDDTIYASSGGGFAALRVGKDELVIEFVRADARTQFAYVIRKR